MKIQKGKKYVCVKDLTIEGASFTWSYSAGVIYEALSDDLILGDPIFKSFDPSSIGIRELSEEEKDSFVLYDKGLVSVLVKNGFYIRTKNYETFVDGKRTVSHYAYLSSESNTMTSAVKKECCAPKMLKAGDRIIYKVGDKPQEYNGFPYYSHAEVQEVSDNLKYIKIFEKWRSMSDIEILDTVYNGEKGDKLG